MTPEIEERIAQLRRGELPDGYKRTKAGIMPEEWENRRLETFCRMKSGNSITSASIYQTGTYPCYGGNGLRGYTDTFTHTGKYVLIGRQGALCGNVLFVDGTFYASEHAVVTECDERASIAFCYHLFKHMNLNRYSEASAQPGLSVQKILRLTVSIPPLAEQRKIADILSAQDKIIELKERLLAEKQRQKKYLMQRLLTGKQRLPGFCGAWESLQAKNVFRNITDKNHNGDLEVLSATQDKGIIPRSQTDIDIKYDDSALPTYKKVKQGNFVISLRSFQGGIEYSAYEGLVSPAYTVLENKIPIDSAYYKQYFKSSRYIAQLQVAVYGIRDGKQISYDDFGFIEICYPPVDEQRAIGEILSTADREIDLLRRGLEQEKRVKKSLSQLLLTGIVRV